MAVKDKTAFITGSGRNIGRAIAIDLAEKGFNIVINGSSDRAACEEVAERVQEAGAEAMIAMGNVGNADEARAMAADALARFGRIDALINNAARRPSKPFLEMTDADWHDVLDVDLSAAFYLSQSVLPGMVEAGWGRIVNFAGMNAIHGYSGRAPVSVAKHGAWGLTKALAKEFGPRGVTVNCISPGPIESVRDSADDAHHINSQVSKIPLGRLGTPAEVAALCGFLCSDPGGFVSGQMIACNGGAET